MKENLNLSITGEIDMYSLKDGELTDHMHFKNLVLSSGKRLIVNRLLHDTNTNPNPSGKAYLGKIGLGSGNVAPKLTDSGLQQPLSGLTSLSVTKSFSENVMTLSTSVTFTSSVNISEMILTNDVGDTVFSRATFPTVTVQAGETRLIVWTITIN